MISSLTGVALLAAQPAAATLGDIRMHLFYQETGRLSPDISPPNDFTGWNTVIGEGSAEEAADDLLVVAEVRTTGEQNVETPLRIVARGGPGNRVLAQRSWTGLLTSTQGRAYLPLYVPGASCAGEIRVTVTLGRATRSETLTLACGE
jgi:hypothetical protein